MAAAIRKEWTLETVANEVLHGELFRNGKDLTATRISDITVSSKAVERDHSLFVAITGTTSDGHRYLGAAAAAGAVAAVISDRSVIDSVKDLPLILVKDTRQALSRLAARWYEAPSQSLQVIGVTGSNGKTTSNWLIQTVLEKLGVPCLRIGTLGYAFQTDTEETGMTTPDALYLHRLLKRGLQDGARAAVMETSSHALHQHRVDDIAFDVGVFTNLTREHFDYHPDFEHYFACKTRLFELVAASPKKIHAAVINLDGAYGDRMLAMAESLLLDIFTTGHSEKARIQIADFVQDLNGSTVTLRYGERRIPIYSPLIGAHNAENIAGAFAALAALGYDFSAIAEGFREVPQVPGRLQQIRVLQNQPFGVFVDYAHTPNAYERILSTLRPLATSKLWVLFGCGGDRDRGKRPEMVRAALAAADKVILSTDNPRTENPDQIFDDMLAGIEDQSRITVERDRRVAIEQMIFALQPGDVAVLIGKGIEDYQIMGKEKIHFSDIEESYRALKLRSEHERAVEDTVRL
jgi:UDP-N-acetylmuramoyl-L-alanyl-D-glutamate--2,6-diaminopimelate ligase